jgi:uncharacterized RDD family membrane protein YckC
VMGMAPGPDQAVCSECQGVFGVQDMIPYGNIHVCANCKPFFMQKLAEGAQILKPVLNYAGFWIRVAAKVLDWLILGVPLGIIFMVIMFSVIGSLAPSGRTGSASGPPLEAILLGMGGLLLGYVAIAAIYHIVLIGKYGATWGKMICNLRVVTGLGEPVTYPRATGRYFTEMGIVFLGNMFCYILGYSDYLAVLFDKEKRALHDHICNTRVVMKS